MSTYSERDVERLLGLSRAVVHGFVDAGFVAPARGDRNELQFSFQDLILLKTAQGLASARIPARRLKESLARLRAELPPSLPLSGVRISALGRRIVVQHGSVQWHADSGQVLLDFSAPGLGSDAANSDADANGDADADVRPSLPVRAPDGSDTHGVQDGDARHVIARAAELEAFDAEGAEKAYRRALELDPDLLAAYVNLGCLLQAQREPAAAEQVYRDALARFPGEALLHFNLATALEDARRMDEARVVYERALAIDPAFADAHYNLARIHEAAGHARLAIRHLSEYRRLSPR